MWRQRDSHVRWETRVRLWLCPDTRAAAAGRAGPWRRRGLPVGGIVPFSTGLVHSASCRRSSSTLRRASQCGGVTPPGVGLPLSVCPPVSRRTLGCPPFWLMWRMLPRAFACTFLCGRLVSSPLGSCHAVESPRPGVALSLAAWRRASRFPGQLHRPTARGQAVRAPVSSHPHPHFRYLPF